MVGLIVKAAIFPQKFQNSDTACGEQAIGAQNHQNDCYKEKEKGLYRVGNGNGNPVTASQQKDTDDSQQPAGLGFFFTHLSAPEQFDGVGQVNLPQAVEENQEKQNAEQNQS